MSYKPLSQTVTDGQKNPISSDAVHDHVAAEIGAIPASASLTLDNLTAPTAVNQDLLLNAGKKIRLNASEDVNSLLHVKSPAGVGTGIFAANGNIATVTVFPSGMFSVGDYIKFAGHSLITRVTGISGSFNTINISNSIDVGVSYPVEIQKVQVNAGFRDSSNNEIFSFVNNAIRYGTGINSNILLGNGSGHLISSGTNNVCIGLNAGSAITTVSNAVSIGNGAKGSGNSVCIGTSAGSSESGIVCIGNNAGIGAGLQSTAIGENAGVAGPRNVAVGNYAGYAIQAAADGNVLIGKDVGFNVFRSGSHNVLIGRNADTNANNTSNAVILGQNCRASSNEFAVNNISTVLLGVGGAALTSTTSTAVTIMTSRASGTDINLSGGGLTLAGSRSTGNQAGSSVFLATAPAGSSGSTLNAHVNRLEANAVGNIRVLTGDLLIETASKGLKIKEGSNATMGVATLAAGTVTVDTTAVKSNSRIMLTTQVPGGTVGFVHVSARTADTSFVITSSEAADTSEVAWLIINPA